MAAEEPARPTEGCGKAELNEDASGDGTVPVGAVLPLVCAKRVSSGRTVPKDVMP